MGSAEFRLFRFSEQGPHARAKGRVPGGRGRRRGVLDENLLRLAASDVSILVQGEFGVGKRRLVRSLHAASADAAASLRVIQCVGLADDALAALVRDVASRRPLDSTPFEPGPTESSRVVSPMVLTEVQELSSKAQTMLVRAFMEVDRASSVRVFATASGDLTSRVARGEFRRDLYHRLAEHVAYVPPLRVRTADIEPLAREFAEEAAASRSLAAPRFSADALAALRAHSWPGNLPQLRNVVRGAMWIAGEGVIRREHVAGQLDLMSSAPTPDDGEPGFSSTRLRGELTTLERKRILEALEQCAGNQTRAAKLLGMSRRTLIKRLDAYQVERPRRRA